MFNQTFLPPEENKKLHVFRYGDFSDKIEPYYLEGENEGIPDGTLIKEPMLERIENAINERVGPYRKKMMVMAKFFFMYQLLGALIVAILAAIIGHVFGFFACVTLIGLYLLGLLIGVRVQHRRGKALEMVYIFNLALVLENLNRNPGEVIPDESLL